MRIWILPKKQNQRCCTWLRNQSILNARKTSNDFQLHFLPNLCRPFLIEPPSPELSSLYPFFLKMRQWHERKPRFFYWFPRLLIFNRILHFPRFFQTWMTLTIILSLVSLSLILLHVDASSSEPVTYFLISLCISSRLFSRPFFPIRIAVDLATSDSFLISTAKLTTWNRSSRGCHITPPASMGLNDLFATSRFFVVVVAKAQFDLRPERNLRRLREAIMHLSFSRDLIR